MGRSYAGLLGPLAFATVLARGLFNASDADATLKIATLCLFVFAAAGFLIGQIAEMIVAESVKTRFRLELTSHEQAESIEASN